MEDIKTCPHCGGEAELGWTQCPQTLDEYDAMQGAHPRRYYVECVLCGARTRMVDGAIPDFYYGDNAIPEWDNPAADRAVQIWNARQ